jgi:hypothetical protein
MQVLCGFFHETQQRFEIDVINLNQQSWFFCIPETIAFLEPEIFIEPEPVVAISII